MYSECVHQNSLQEFHHGPRQSQCPILSRMPPPKVVGTLLMTPGLKWFRWLPMKLAMLPWIELLHYCVHGLLGFISMCILPFKIRLHMWIIITSSSRCLCHSLQSYWDYEINSQQLSSLVLPSDASCTMSSKVIDLFVNLVLQLHFIGQQLIIDLRSGYANYLIDLLSGYFWWRLVSFFSLHLSLSAPLTQCLLPQCNFRSKLLNWGQRHL